MERNEVPQNLKWKTSDIFESDEAWEKEYKAVDELYSAYDFEAAFKGKLGNRDTLLAYFKMQDEMSIRMERLYLYAHMRSDEDVRNSKYTSYAASMGSMISRVFAKISFVEPELTALYESVLKGYVAEAENNPESPFFPYEYSLRQVLQSKAHVLSEGEERIMTLSGDVMGGFQKVFSMLDNADLNLPKASFNGEEIQMSHGMYGMVLHTGTPEERRTWFKKYYEAYIKLIDAITQTYYGNVKKNVFNKTVRKYDSCMAMAMEREDVSPVVYNNLIEAVHNAWPTMHRYIRLHRDAIGLPEQHMYDLYIPLVDNAEIKLPFDEAYNVVIEGLAPLGKDYQELLRRGKEEGWIDVCETEGKRSGAYSTGSYGVHPYVLLNYQPTTNDMFTVAHEMGHSIHTYKSNESQPYAKSNYTIFLAEIASTVNEVLLLKHLYKTTDDKNLKKYLLNYYIDMFRTTLFRQTMFAEFEAIAHDTAEKGTPLTKEVLCDAYYKLNQEYYGDGVIHDEEIAYEWARIPHFYTAFYVYKYATGITSAISIAKRILTEGEPAVKDYFEFLSAGGSTDPVSILKKAGIDLTTKAPFEAAMQEFESTLDELEKLLKE